MNRTALIIVLLFLGFAVHPWTAQGIVQAPALPGAQPISPADRVYTADQVSNTVTVINPFTLEVLGTIALGRSRLQNLFSPLYFGEINTHGLGFSPDGSRLAAIHVTTNSAVVIRTADNRIENTFYLGRGAHEGFISPDGKELWAAIRGQDYVSVVDLASGKETRRITTAPGPAMVIFSPDGRLAFINHSLAAELHVVEVSSHQVVRVIRELASPFSPNLAVSPDGREVWLTHKDMGKVTIVDAESLELMAVIDTGPVTNHVNFVTKPDADFAYVTIGGTNETLVFLRNGAHPVLVDRIPNSGSSPHGLWPSPDNTCIYVVLEDSDAMDVIDTDTREVIATLPVGQQPQTVVYVAGAASGGDGLENLTRQGLDKRVDRIPVEIRDGMGSASAVVRELEGLDMIQVEAAGLSPNSVFTVYFENIRAAVPVMDMRTDSQGRASSLAFTRFFNAFDRIFISRQDAVE
jgi:YVTN family beta-propeller protein